MCVEFDTRGTRGHSDLSVSVSVSVINVRVCPQSQRDPNNLREAIKRLSVKRADPYINNYVTNLVSGYLGGLLATLVDGDTFHLEITSEGGALL